MILNFGRNIGKTIAEVVLRDPAYIEWMLTVDEPTPTMAAACKEARKLIGRFDAKPFVERCCDCDATATRCTFYVGPNLRPQFWCDDCDPYCSGAGHGKLNEIATYGNALVHARFSAGGKKDDEKSVVRALALAKGLPERAGVKQIQAFFQT